MTVSQHNAREQMIVCAHLRWGAVDWGRNMPAEQSRAFTEWRNGFYRMIGSGQEAGMDGRGVGYERGPGL